MRNPSGLAMLATLVACSRTPDSGRPRLTAAIRARLQVLASPCEEHPPQRGDGTVLTCQPTDDVNRARIDVRLLETNRIDQLIVTLREPTVSAAADKLEPAIAEIVDDKARAAIIAKLRVARPEDSVNARVDGLAGHQDAVVYVQPLENGLTDVTLTLLLAPLPK